MYGTLNIHGTERKRCTDKATGSRFRDDEGSLSL